MANVTKEEIHDWLISYMAALLGMNESQVDPTVPFEDYGLDSTAATGLSGDLSEWLGIEFDSSMVFDHPTIAAVIDHVSASV